MQHGLASVENECLSSPVSSVRWAVRFSSKLDQLHHALNPGKPAKGQLKMELATNCISWCASA
jgi:hypothetical protein